jgi:hypothetical protein
MKIVMGALTLVLLASAASAQEVRIGGPERDLGLGVAAHGRLAIPFGPADGDVRFVAGGGGAVVVIDEHLSWAELFRPGWGGEVELDLFLGSSRDSVFGPEASFRYGVYAALGVDHFEGDRESDGLGNSIETDDLDMATAIVGGKLVSSLGDGSRVDGRFGLGVVRYSDVDATFSGSGLGPVETEFLDETWTLVGECRFHWGVEIGPLSLVLGLGFRAQLPPGEGASVDLSGGPFFTFDGDVGLELAF